MLFLDLTVQGLVQGAIYALIALGLTLVYGLLRILHVAHAGLFTLGGYIGVHRDQRHAAALLLALVLRHGTGRAAFWAWPLYRLCLPGRSWTSPPLCRP